MPQASSTTKDHHKTHPMTIRVVVEGVVSLLLAVVLCRFFLMDNYIVPTGSMALGVFGYHKRVECPDCHHSFVFGVKEKDDDEHNIASCPNCGLGGIDISEIPRSHGDQLLVQKQAYTFRQPHRWEVIVFWNPKDIDPPYVKRLVALPGETVQVVKGDVHIGGEISRKKLSTQRAMRIPVYLHDFEPQDSTHWQSRWMTTSTSEISSQWKRQGQRFVLSAANQSPEDVASVSYRHWIRNGGKHETTVRIDRSAHQFELPERFDSPISYIQQTGRLSCVEGVLNDRWYNRLMELNSQVPEFVNAINRLAAKSHIAPIPDAIGYQKQQHETAIVRDLMMSLEVTIQKGDGDFQLVMTDGRLIAECTINMKSQELKLNIHYPHEEPQEVQSVSLSQIKPGVPFQLEMSLIDRQISVAIDEAELFSPWKYPERDEQSMWWQKPVWFSASQLDVEVAHLSLYRDVYYNHRYHKNGVDEPFLLGENEYYFLGDNSPISFDSRGWQKGAVNGNLFIGKPFAVHLPSKPQSFKIGKWKGTIRIPDFPRMKYIR